MAKIINPGPRQVVLPTGHVVPAAGVSLGELVTTNAVLNSPDNAPMLKGMALAGQITLEYDAESPGGDEPATAPVVEALPAAEQVADTLDLLADSAVPPLPRPRRAPRPAPVEPE